MKRVALLDRLVALHTDLTREQLLSYVLCGDVRVNESRIRDPRSVVGADDAITLSGERFVGRGGIKLDGALDAFGVDVTGLVVVDAGASTGGFTDCLLQRGARAVHAVDVGRNQLAYRLRVDDRVIVHEETNILAVDALDPAANLAVADLSFRSLRGAARHILGLTTLGRGVFLLKPQFEWSAAPADFDGVVPDARLPEILASTARDLQSEGVGVERIAESRITGRSGNREFFLLAVDSQAESGPGHIGSLVERALRVESPEGGSVS